MKGRTMPAVTKKINVANENAEHLFYAAEPPAWLSDYQCCLCLETAVLPVRVPHRDPEADCGLILCRDCHQSWISDALIGGGAAAAVGPLCPRCREPCDADGDRAPDAFLCRQLASRSGADPIGATRTGSGPVCNRRRVVIAVYNTRWDP